MTIEQIASIAHMANRELCYTTSTEDHETWALCSKEHQDRMIVGVRWNILNPDASDSAQHDQWMEKMTADGWVYGTNGRDEEAKTHHCMVPYDQLPPHQRAKDALFRGIVKALTPFWDGKPSVSP